MPQCELANTTEASHHGRWSQVRPSQRPDGAWECAYTILEIGPTRSSSIKRHHGGSFATREEAEASALDAAQAEIDARGPLT
jgi:hypothetical protein